jgi:hypothetical protein
MTVVTVPKKLKNFRIFLTKKHNSFEKVWSESDRCSEGNESEFPAKRQLNTAFNQQYCEIINAMKEQLINQY